MKEIRKQMEKIPINTEYHANRYDTDDTLTLHVWDDDGNSFDIIVSKYHSRWDLNDRIEYMKDADIMGYRVKTENGTEYQITIDKQEEN